MINRDLAAKEVDRCFAQINDILRVCRIEDEEMIKSQAWSDRYDNEIGKDSDMIQRHEDACVFWIIRALAAKDLTASKI